MSYRRGYYAEQPTSVAEHKQSTSLPVAAARQATMQAMVRGAPGSTQILFKVLVAPASTITESEVAEGNVTTPATKGPFQRYSVNYSAVPQDITFLTISEDLFEAHLEFIVFVYNVDGTLLNRFSQSLRAKVSVEGLKKLQDAAIPFHQVVSVPVKGENYLRIGVHDLNSDRIGVLEVPVSAVRDLAVVAPSIPPTPAPQRSAPTLSPLHN